MVAADVYANPDHVGRGGWTWYTGSSGWMYKVIEDNFKQVDATSAESKEEKKTVKRTTRKKKVEPVAEEVKEGTTTEVENVE